MNTAMIFAILGIPETKDEAIIRDAYRQKLAAHNPEDDPEGFRRLREAYEHALAFARTTDAEEEEEEDNTPSGLWMKRAADIYFHLSKRLDDSAWEALLKEDICLDLEEGEEIKWKLFYFLTSHYRLNASTYRLLDEFFHIQKDVDNLKERLPEGFVYYMLNRIQDQNGEDDFPYQWVQGADDADYDEFQNQLYHLEEFIHEQKWEEAEQTAAAMEQLNIQHPYYHLATLQLTAAKGDKRAGEEVRSLLSAYEENAKIQVLGTEILWNCGFHEEAAQIYLKLEDKFGTYYLTEKYLTLYEKEQGNVSKALRHCFLALERTDDDSLESLIKELNQAYITECENALAAGTLTQEDASRLCTSYIGMEYNQKGIDFLQTHPEYFDNMESGHKYLTILFYQAGKLQESEQESRLWQQTAEEQIARLENTSSETDDPAASDDRENHLSRYRHDLSMAYDFQAKAYWGMAEQTKDRQQAKTLNSYAEKALGQALEYAPDYPQIRQELLDLFISEKKYEEAAILADEILVLDKNWFPALAQKQKACYHLNRAQEVIDLFYEAKKIYTKYSEIYEYAAKIFMDYGQYQDAEGILAQAKEEEVLTPDLDYLALRLERLRSQSDLQYFEVLRKAQELLAKFRENNVRSSLLGDLYHEMAIIEDCQYYAEFVHPGKAEEYITAAIELRQNDPPEEYCDYFYVQGCILKNAGKYKEALEAYQLFVSYYDMTEGTAINMAQCEDYLGNWEDAVRLYEQVLIINPEHETANRRIANLYKKVDNDIDSIPLLLKALTFANRQIELSPNSHSDYWNRGIIYRRLGLLEQAMEDADQALKLNKNFFLGLNLKGKLLYYQGKYSQALFYLKKALANLEQPTKNGHGLALCSNAMKVCTKMGKPDQAEEWLRKGIELLDGSDQAWCYKILAWNYEERGDFDEALRLFRESFEKENISETLYQEHCLAVKTAQCRYMSPEEITKLELEALSLAQKYDSIDLWENLSDIQYYFLMDMEKALSTKRKVMEMAEKENDWWEHKEKLLERMQIYWELGNQEEVNQFARLYLQAIEERFCYETEKYPSLEQYLTHPYNRRENTCDMVKYWIFTGQMDRAKEALEQLSSMPSCPECRRTACTAFPEVLAIYNEASGNLEKAYKFYQQLLTVLPGSYIGFYKVQQLSSKTQA
ncbi:MAG: tetratricopeptide repeat protein [Lachnospiraceae bacterium]|nr:tetratricopeptide repeat protein [Lachnospiraceae bacterium]